MDFRMSKVRRFDSLFPEVLILSVHITAGIKYATYRSSYGQALCRLYNKSGTYAVPPAWLRCTDNVYS